MSEYTLLVNSTDSFSDCWIPFFTLFAKYWPDPKPPIVLNTEHAEFAFPGLDIRCSKVGDAPSGGARTWSECLNVCLQSIKTDQVLYVQEDYFLEGPVRTEWIDAASEQLVLHDAACMRLAETDGSGPWSDTGLPWLWKVDRSARYLVSLQAGMWSRAALGSILRAHETAWDFELLGSRRAARHGLNVYCLSRDQFAEEKRAVPYTPTGVTMGRWNEAVVVPLFARHGIEVDFSKRGFHVAGWHPRNTMSRRFRRLITMARSYR